MLTKPPEGPAITCDELQDNKTWYVCPVCKYTWKGEHIPGVVMEIEPCRRHSRDYKEYRTIAFYKKWGHLLNPSGYRPVITRLFQDRHL